MTDDRWPRIKTLFQAAVERPAADRDSFLASAAGDDPELRREVESLLASDAADAGLFDRLPLASPGDLAGLYATDDLMSEPPLVPTLGSDGRLGAYDIVSLLGVGGMGEVYRARDTRLQRDVALKVLPAAVASDPGRLVRFKREAQLLAALNHPNIAAIYGLEDSSPLHALVLELVDGPTLAERIAVEGLPLPEVLAIAGQIAEALEAAHDKGIVHRDLKPANIKIDGTGAVKVLDFGLAKAASPDPMHPDLTDSREGMILGTASYMSPEQARGQRVDRRSDIWAFGCVLYEMLARRRAFPGDTFSDTVVRILEREPDWSALPPSTPPLLRRLLPRCLEKDPKQRMRDAGDVRIEIGALDKALPGDVGIAPRDASRARGTWMVWGAIATLAAAVLLWEVWRPAPAQENPLADAEFTRFTDWEGTESGGEISPDGRFVAFVADLDGEFDLWLSQVGSGQFTNLTKNLGPLSPPGIVLRSFGFSGDGAEIWMSLSGSPSASKVLMPLTGGTPRAFLPEGAATPSWSPDGTRLAYFVNGDGDPLFLANSRGGDARRIDIRDRVAGNDFFKSGMHNHNLTWSPDGQWIYFARGVDPTVSMDVWRVRPDGGVAEPITEQKAAVNFMAAIDTRTVLYVARPEDRSGPYLWALDVPTGTARRVNSGVERYTSISASRDGRRAVATVANPSASFWRVPLLGRLAEDGDARPYPLATTRVLAPRFAGKSLLYLSSGSLWRVEGDEVSEVWKSTDDVLSEPPAVSADGRRLAMVTRQTGRPQLLVMSADGTGSRTLAASIDILGTAAQTTAAWSPDGAWIVTGGSDAQGPGLFKMPVEGGAPIRLVTGQATNPAWSPNGNLIVYAGAFVGGQSPLLAVRPDGAPVTLPAARVRPGGYRFLPDGTGLVFLPQIQSLDFLLLDLEAKIVRPLTRLSHRGVIGTFDISPDGAEIVFDRARENSDIVLIDLTKQGQR